MMTCTIATCKKTPRRPTAMEAAAITAGPVRNLTAIAKAAVEFPHAIILGCNAINRPVLHQQIILFSVLYILIHGKYITFVLSLYNICKSNRKKNVKRGFFKCMASSLPLIWSVVLLLVVIMIVTIAKKKQVFEK